MDIGNPYDRMVKRGNDGKLRDIPKREFKKGDLVNVPRADKPDELWEIHDFIKDPDSGEIIYVRVRSKISDTEVLEKDVPYYIILEKNPIE